MLKVKSPGPALVRARMMLRRALRSASSIGQHLHLPVVAKSADEAAAHFGWLARFAALNLAASSTYTQQQLGWYLAGPDLLRDVDQHCS